MTQFLASVKNKSEAEIAYLGGADIIDLKNPAAGALGAVSLNTVQTISEIMKNRATVSATIGDLPAEPDVVYPAVARLIKHNIDIIKIGFFSGKQHSLASSLANHASQHKLVAVLFADQNPDKRLLKTLSDSHFYGVILDTARKNDQGLLQHLSSRELEEFIQISRLQQLRCGFAGQLQRTDIPALLKLKPDYLGFRSALCENSRAGKISSHALQQVRKAIPQAYPEIENKRQLA